MSKKQLKQVAIVIISAACIGLSVWVLVMVGKKISYTLLYEDQVQQTIHETVKPEYLREL